MIDDRRDLEAVRGCAGSLAQEMREWCAGRAGEMTRTATITRDLTRWAEVLELLADPRAHGIGSGVAVRGHAGME